MGITSVIITLGVSWSAYVDDTEVHFIEAVLAQNAGDLLPYPLYPLPLQLKPQLRLRLDGAA